MRNLLRAALVMCAAGCAHNSQITGKPEVVTHEDDLRKQAAFDLGCNEQRMDVMNMNPDTAAISGCDQKATYKWGGTSWTLANKEGTPPPAAAQ